MSECTFISMISTVSYVKATLYIILNSGLTAKKATYLCTDVVLCCGWVVAPLFSASESRFGAAALSTCALGCCAQPLPPSSLLSLTHSRVLAPLPEDCDVGRNTCLTGNLLPSDSFLSSSTTWRSSLAPDWTDCPRWQTPDWTRRVFLRLRHPLWPSGTEILRTSQVWVTSWGIHIMSFLQIKLVNYTSHLYLGKYFNYFPLFSQF